MNQTIALELPADSGAAVPWRRILLASVLTLMVALYFWTQSRYPALDAKASMGGETPIAGISFDTLVEILPNDGKVWDIVGNAINWAWTNWKGMTFGFLFGACALTLLSQFQRRSFQHPIANASLGAVIGAPLGVCVNCAAPIARGLHSAGLRLETTLAAMVASPTLNVIVVSMTFALLPFYMAVAKLAAMLLFILFGIPLIVRFVGGNDASTQAVAKLQAEAPQARRKTWHERFESLREMDNAAPRGEGWIGAAKWLTESFLRNLAFIVATTLPLMLLAGALGAVAITLLPFDDIKFVLGISETTAFRLVAVFAIAVVCIFLPVPMTFDVILAAVLIGSGWPAILVMPALMCLGSFSVYSYLVVGRAISFRLATAMLIALVGVGIATTGAAWKFDKEARLQSAKNDRAYLKNDFKLYRLDPKAGAGESAAALASAVAPFRVTPQPANFAIADSGRGRASVAIDPLGGVNAAAAGTPFTRLPGDAIGLDLAPSLSGLELIEPYTMYWGAASGDIDGDGWTDVALARPASEGGLALFRNVGGRFRRQALDLPQVDKHFVNALALVDFDNDGAPDLFVSTFLHGAYVYWNRGGFSAANMVALDNGNAVMIGAPGFADIDGDGRVDILAGNWTTGTIGNNARPFLETSRDRVLWNDGNRFTPQLLDGLPGETLTSLITDVNGDRQPDLLIGDDISTSDKIYLNKGGRKFELVRKDENLVPYLTFTTMSLDSGDIAHTGLDSLYAVQIAFHHKKEQFDPDTTFCVDPLSVMSDKASCFVTMRDRSAAYLSAHGTYSECADIPDSRWRTMCAALSVIRRAGFTNDPGVCDAIPAGWPDMREHCTLAAGARVRHAEKTMRAEGYIGGVHGRNVLLRKASATGGYADETNAFGVAQPGWSWNSKFADLDQDGWQDILVASGMLIHRSVLPVTYYRNAGGRSFSSESGKWGFEDKIPSASYLLLDYDRDGDMDVIRPSIVTQPLVHRADGVKGKALWIRLDDRIGNRSGLGAVIRVKTGDTWQTREIRQSGGFDSYDSPQAHFGLGQAARVDAIEVTWRDGSKTTVTGPVAPNSELTITRS